VKRAIVKLTLFDGVPLFCRKVSIGKQMSAKIAWPLETDELTAGTAWLWISAVARI
jgi:hypothetical protein